MSTSCALTGLIEQMVVRYSRSVSCMHATTPPSLAAHSFCGLFLLQPQLPTSTPVSRCLPPPPVWPPPLLLLPPIHLSVPASAMA